MKLHFGLNEDLLKYGIKQEITVDTYKNAIALLQGGTGSGKTYALKRLLAYCELDLERSKENGCIYLLDYKGDDTFTKMHSCVHYFSFDKCLDGLNEYYSILLSRQNGDPDRSFCMLVWDEYASYLESLPDKKTENEVKAKVATLVMLQRSFHMATVFCLQAGYSETFNKIRGNISAILTMGHLTRELKTMFYSSVADEIDQDKLQGQGSLLIDGCQLYNIVIPKITDTEKLDNYIVKLLNRKLDSNNDPPPAA